MKKLYIVQKYVLANSIEQAIKKEKEIKPDDVYLDNNWRQNQTEKNDYGFKQKSK